MICNSCGSEWPNWRFGARMFGSARGLPLGRALQDPCQPATDAGKRETEAHIESG